MGAPQYEQAGADIGGTGTTNTIPRWTGPSTLGDSILSQDANARAVSIGGTAYTGWGAGQNALQVGLRTALADIAGIVTLSYNAVRDGATGNWLRIGADAPTQYSAVSGAHSWLYAASGAANSVITWTTGMTMTSAGNVGIGTASPGVGVGARGLDIYGVDAQYRLHNAASGPNATDGLILSLDVNANGYLWNYEAQSLIFGTNNTERARIDSAGRLLVGTSTAPGSAAVRSVLASNSGVYAGVQNTGTNVGCAFGAGAANFELYTSSGVYGVETYTQRMAVSSAGTAAQSQVAIGTSSFTSGRALTTVADLDVFGVRVGRGPGDIATNTAIGAGALSFCTTGSENTVLGQNAGFGISTGVRNVMIGVATGSGGTVTGSRNTVVGRQAGNQLTSGSDNVLLGTQASDSITTGSSNTAVGMEALRSHTSGNNNTAIGWRAGYGAASANANTTGSDNIYVGRETVGTANNNTNEIVIGAGAIGNGSNTATLGNSSTVSIHLDAKFVRLVDSYTVGTLPVAGTAGRIARVTDGDAALAWGATVVNTGAGATPYLVWDNGTNWTVFGK